MSVLISTQSSYNFLVSEDVELNTTLGVIEAVDLDRGSNGDIAFEIISGNTDLFSLITIQVDSIQTHAAWLINNQVSRGALRTFCHSHEFLYCMQGFDYEEQTSYVLSIRVQNTVAPPFDATADVVITIRDTNDNPPVFSMPAGYSITVPEIPEEAVDQRPIGTVVATDDDGGLNGTVSDNGSGLRASMPPMILFVMSTMYRCGMGLHQILTHEFQEHSLSTKQLESSL